MPEEDHLIMTNLKGNVIRICGTIIFLMVKIICKAEAEK